jgi:16S rRNA (cytosine1402-N4)-methyltransferase
MGCLRSAGLRRAEIVGGRDPCMRPRRSGAPRLLKPATSNKLQDSRGGKRPAPRRVTRRALHQSVLLEECLALLGAQPGELAVDATVGFGGHAEAILERISPDGRLIGLDKDDEALREARRRMRRFGDRVQLVRTSFRDLRQALSKLGITQANRVLFDLGVSSPQIDNPERGFRFSEDTAEVTPLDMRMDRRSNLTAADLLATASEKTLADWFGRYGELPGSKRLARAIVERRRRDPLRTAADLLGVIREARVGGSRRHHSATLVFQALRIVVNDEMDALAEGIEDATELLAPGGRLAVIAYHSLEDRIVKQRFRMLERGCICSPKAPACTCGRSPRLHQVTKRPVRPSPEEVANNPRSRSARLRVAEKIGEAA